MRAQRRLFLFLAAVTAAIAVLQAVSGVADFAFYAGPPLILVGLLLSGRVPGEEWIVARRTAKPVRRLRPVRRRWVRDRERPLASLVERSPQLLRGPPAVALAACR